MMEKQKKIRIPVKMSSAHVIGAGGGLVAVKHGTGRYPFKVARPATDGGYEAVSQAYSSEAEVLADLGLRTRR